MLPYGDIRYSAKEGTGNTVSAAGFKSMRLTIGLDFIREQGAL